MNIQSAWEKNSFKFAGDEFCEFGGECSVVGNEEHNEKLILLWQRKSNFATGNGNHDIAIKIGLFDTKTTDINVIFKSNEQLNVIHCSVDSNLKTLAMVCETLPSYTFGFTESSELDGSAEVTYSCYWTPLKISEEDFISVLPLNKESSQMMKVQLLSATQLLILNPREAIYLYTLPTCEFIGYHNAMTSPVLYERLIGPFLWAEYNILAGQLFYIYLKNNNQNVEVLSHYSVNNDANKLNPILVGLKFHNGTVYETVLQTPIDLLHSIPQVKGSKVNLQNVYSKFNPLSNKIYNPVLKMEISVYTMAEGEAYICQGIVDSDVIDEETLISDDKFKEVNVKYSISILHHSCILNGHIKGMLPSNLENKKIMFVPRQGYLLVAMPGIFTHLLDVGLEHGPCNHLLLLGCDLPSIESNEASDFTFTSSHLFKSSQMFTICSSKEIKQLLISLTKQSLLDLFISDNVRGTSAQQYIVHHLLTHFDDVANVEKLLKNLTMDPVEPQIVKIFQEFLLGGAYYLAKHHIDKKCYKLLPITVDDAFQPQEEFYLDGKLRMSITYSMIKNIKNILLSPTERKVTHNRVADLWFRLWQKARSHHIATSRFSSKSMRHELLGIENDLPQRRERAMVNSGSTFDFSSKSFCPLACISQECSVHPAASFCRRFLESVTEKRFDLVMESERLQAPEEDIEVFCGDGYTKLERIISMNLRKVTKHLTKHLHAAPPSVIKESASFYVSDRLEQSQNLCHIIFHLATRNSLVPNPKYDPYIFLNSLTSSSEKLLFKWLERYLVAVEEIAFPLPKGFEAFFSVLSYKCLNIRTFLQYLDFGVVQLNSEVLKCITADATAVAKTMPQSQLNDDNVMLEIINRLPKDAAIHFLQHLKCNTTRLLQVHNIVERYCNHQCNSKQNHKYNEFFTSSLDSQSNKPTYEHVASLESPNDSTSDEDELLHSYGIDFYAHMFENEEESKMKKKVISRAPCASAADMKFIKDTQLRNIASEGSNRARVISKVRPPVGYWR